MKRRYEMPGEQPGFFRSVDLVPERIADRSVYPFDIPVLRSFTSLDLHPRVTYLVGENGSGKSTFLEAIAVAAGFNAEGGTKNFRFATRRSESPLHGAIRLVRSHRRPRTGYFLRAESLFNVASEIEALDQDPQGGPPIIGYYGGVSLHEQSHGQSFLALLKNRFGPQGFYILDEPEAALSPARQLSLLVSIHALVAQGSQFIIATHAPIVLAYPDALIYELDVDGSPPTPQAYEKTQTVQTTASFLEDPTRWVSRLLADE